MSEGQENLWIVIMAGGAGTRFWPLSTKRRPKQFIPLFEERSLLQMSWDRVANLVPPDRILVLTNADYVSLVGEQLPELPPRNIIGEPHRRDTAAAVCLASLLVRRRAPNGVIASLTADHLIEPVEVFQNTLLSAVEAASRTEALYTFGIRPEYPATGYGYLELGEEVEGFRGVACHRLRQFKEKPDEATARRYLKSGKFMWNSGMFVWSVKAIMRELTANLPAHVTAVERAVTTYETEAWEGRLEEAFRGLAATSIDFGVMERAADVRCITSEFSWSDVGGWRALSDRLPADSHGNRHRGKIAVLEARDNLVFCEGDDEVALLGVENLIVVRAGGRTLVAAKERAEEVKKLVKDNDLD